MLDIGQVLMVPGYEWSRSGFERAAITSGRASAKLTTVESMLAGAIAGSATVILTNPIWVVNTRMTARKEEAKEDLGGRPAKKPTTFGTLMKMIQEEGPTSLFAGVMPVSHLATNAGLSY